MNEHGGKTMHEVWHEVRLKVLVVAVSAVVLGAGSWATNWAATNVVFASDLEGLADMIARDVAQALAPLTQEVRETNQLARQNAEDIAVIRVEAVRGQIRTLQSEIDKMIDRRENGGEWTETDAILLAVWQEDLRELAVTLNKLDPPARVERIP